MMSMRLGTSLDHIMIQKLFADQNTRKLALSFTFMKLYLVDMLYKKKKKRRKHVYNFYWALSWTQQCIVVKICITMTVLMDFKMYYVWFF